MFCLRNKKIIFCYTLLTDGLFDTSLVWICGVLVVQSEKHAKYKLMEGVDQGGPRRRRN